MYRYEEIPLNVSSLDFQAIKRKMLDPIEGNGMSSEQIDFVEREYRRFLALRVFHPEAALVPNRVVDEFWHAHILDTMAYEVDCQRVFGAYLHHYPYLGLGSAEARKDLSDAFSVTRELYERHFGTYPAEECSAARCKGHACHSPSPCACRVPGACRSAAVLAAAKA